MDIAGRCHCDNIALDIRWPGEPAEIRGRACDCSFCIKHAGVWTSTPDAALEVTVADPRLVSRYAFGTRSADFHVCGRCGVVPLVTCEIAGRVHAVVNVHTLDEAARALVRVVPVSFGVEELEARLERRQRNWIGAVRFRTA